MAEPLSVLVASTSKDHLARIKLILDGTNDVRTESKLLGGNGHADPLHGIAKTPDVLILVLGLTWELELDSLGTSSGGFTPPFIVLAPPEGDLNMMRRAMQRGARDFLAVSVAAEELQKCLRKVASEIRKPAAKPGGSASINAVINCKGGSGASFVSASLAHVLAKNWQQRVALLDLDLQFGVQDLCLDLKPRTGLLQAIARVDQLDAVALEGCMGVHESGVRLLGEYGPILPLHWEVPSEGLMRVLKLAAATFDQVIVDLPRQIDPLTISALEAANVIYVITSQSLIHVRDARRMQQILMRDLKIQKSRIRFVVNRYEADTTVTLRDIQSALDVQSLIQIPNDYRRASEAMNLGIPVSTKHPGSPIAKAFVEMATGLAGAPNRQAGGLRKALAGLFGQGGGTLR